MTIKIPSEEQEDRLWSIWEELATFKPESVRETALVADLRFALELVEELIRDRDLWKARSHRRFRIREPN